MSRLAAALLRCVLHLEAIALAVVEAAKVRNRRRMLGGGVRRWAHSSSWRVLGVFGAECWLCYRRRVEWRSGGSAQRVEAGGSGA